MLKPTRSHDTHPHPPKHTGETCCAGHAVPVNAVLDAAEIHCHQRGLRLTPQRRAVLDALAKARGPLGAYDLIEALRSDGARGPAPIAIYRALDFLKENGFIHRLESLNAFIACPHHHTHGEKVVFLICESCRHVEEATGKPLDEALAKLAHAHGFTPARQVVELAGTCRHCHPSAAKA